MSGEQDFWSRRRAAVAAETAEDEASRAEEQHAVAEAAFEGKSDEEILAELELPMPENLRQGDDFSVFMTKAVPERIRRRALRVLWRSNPVLANVDQLVDYGGDFTDKATVIDDLKTTYQVGKGMLKHIEALAAQTEETAQEEVEPELPEAESLVSGVRDDPADSETLVAYEEAEAQDYDPTKPRRMKFIVEETA